MPHCFVQVTCERKECAQEWLKKWEAGSLSEYKSGDPTGPVGIAGGGGEAEVEDWLQDGRGEGRESCIHSPCWLLRELP